MIIKLNILLIPKRNACDVQSKRGANLQFSFWHSNDNSFYIIQKLPTLNLSEHFDSWSGLKIPNYQN